MAFVQIIEFRTADIDGVRHIDEEWRPRAIRSAAMSRNPPKA